MAQIGTRSRLTIELRKFSSKLQCRKIPEEIHIKLENRIYPYSKHKKPDLKKFEFFGKSHGAENPQKTNPLGLRNPFSKPELFKK